MIPPVLSSHVYLQAKEGLPMSLGILLFSALLLAPSAWGEGQPVILVTEKEARLPDAKLPPYEDFLKQRDLFDTFRQFSSPKEGESAKGPEISLIRPKDGGIYAGPLEIDVRFIPRTGPVDLKTLNVEYVKLWGIDITGRIRPYATKEGIKLQNAQFPSGNHRVKISIGDAGGNFSSRTFSVRVQ
jgi:hypothetical protein